MNEKELAVNLLKVFGYINATEENVILLDSRFGYVAVEFCHIKVKFTRKNKSWVIEEI